jgi:WD40 repeat protein/serine/threonine protein kinase
MTAELRMRRLNDSARRFPGRHPLGSDTQPPREARARALFEAALGLECVVEREALIETQAADDPAVRERARNLLDAHARSRGFLEAALRLPAGMIAEETRCQPEQAGDRLGPYRLLERLGEGGFGAVWRAEQEWPLPRKVALKIVKPGMDSRQVIARFEQEREVLSRMQHPNIARVFDAGMTPQGRPYFVMELVQGPPITAYCDQRALPIEERLQLFVQICRALQHAHDKGVLHRDLKPSNVLVTEFDGIPQPKLIDFGVAKALQPAAEPHKQLTRTEQLVGTPLYMSPEQVAGQSDLDCRSDTYGLGVLLYEVLTGQLPRPLNAPEQAALEETRRIIREVEAPAPSQAVETAGLEPARRRQTTLGGWRSQLRGDLDAIVLKALQKERADRYPSAGALAADLMRHLQNEPVEARPPGWMGRMKKRLRRHRAATVATLAVAAALGLGGWAAWQQAREARRQKVAAEIARTENQRQAAAQALAQETARQQALAAAAAEAARQQAEAQARSRADLASGVQRLQEGQWQEGLAYLGRALRADPASAAAQTALWLAVQHRMPDRDRWARFEWHHPDEVTQARYSADGRHILTVCADRIVRVWDAESGQPAGSPLVHQTPVSDAIFSADGQSIYTGNDGHLSRWETATGRLAEPAIAPEERGREVALSADGRLLSVAAATVTTGQPSGAALSPTGRQVAAPGFELRQGRRLEGVRVWSSQARTPEGPLLVHGAEVSALSFSPDGQHLATGSRDRWARIWEVAAGKIIAQAGPFPDWVHAIAYSPDGSRIALAAERTLQWIDAATGRSLTPPITLPSRIAGVRFSPEGGLLLVWTADGAAALWDIAQGEKLRPEFPPTAAIASAEFSPDGARLLISTQDRAARVWDLGSGRFLGAPLPHQNWVRQASFSPDGTRLLTGSLDGTARLWDAQTGRPETPRLRHGDDVVSAEFDSTGARILTAGKDGRARLWEAATGEPIGAPMISAKELLRAGFSADGARVLTICRDQSVRVWAAASGEPMTPPMTAGAAVERASFSPDGTRVAIGGADGTVQLWNAVTGTAQGISLRHAAPARIVQFSAGGDQLLTASLDGAARLWDAATGQSMGEPMTHPGGVADARFSLDGQHIVTAGFDQTARMWNAATGAPAGSPWVHHGKVLQAMISPNGRLAVTLGQFSIVTIWDAASGQPLGEPISGILGLGNFTPDGRRFVMQGVFSTARIIDLQPPAALPGASAESYTAALSGGRLDAATGQLQLLSREERRGLRARLRTELAAHPAWEAALNRVFEPDPQRDPITPSLGLTVRQGATALFETLNSLNYAEARQADPGHPLLALANAHQSIEQHQGARPETVHWWVRRALHHLPADLQPAELLAAARLLIEISRAFPEHRASAREMLDRTLAAQIDPAEIAALEKRLPQ